MSVETDLGIVTQFGDQSGYRSATPSSTRAPGVDALAAGVGHDAACFGDDLRRQREWLIIRNPTVQAQLPRQPEVLDRDVGLGAVGGDPADLSAVVLSGADVVLGAETRQHQEGDLGALRGLGRRLDQPCSGFWRTHG